jgi:hypothetical protein
MMSRPRVATPMRGRPWLRQGGGAPGAEARDRGAGGGGGGGGGGDGAEGGGGGAGSSGLSAGGGAGGERGERDHAHEPDAAVRERAGPRGGAGVCGWAVFLAREEAHAG